MDHEPRLAPVRAALLSLIAERRYQPLQWGERDCCLWAADFWLAASGRDFAEGLRGRYASRFGALRALRRCGYHSVADLIASRLARVRRARLGSVVLTGEGPLNALLIAESAHRAWGQDAHGLVSVPMPPAASFWEPA